MTIAAWMLLVSACSSADLSSTQAPPGPTTSEVAETSAESESAAGDEVDATDAATSQIGADSWPTFRLDPQRSAFDGSDSARFDEPELLWSFQTGGVVESSPAVVDGTVYVGTFDDNLFALDATTGEQRWAFPVGGLVRASPAVVDGRVFFGADDDLFYAVDAATGSELWRFPLGRGGEQSSPAVVDNVVYFGAFDRNVYALDAQTGEELWSFETGAGILSSPLVANGVIYIGSIDGNFYALDAATGDQQWAVTTGGSIFSSGAWISDSDGPDGRAAVVFGSDDGRIYAVDAQTGESRWNIQTAAPVFATPAVVGGEVIIGSRDGSLLSIAASSGVALWGVDLREVLSSAAVDAERIYVGSSDGTLHVLDRDGTPLTQLRVGELVWTSPAVVDDHLFFGAHDGNVYGYRVG